MEIYDIGEKVWYASVGSKKEYILCPDCFGKKYVTIIFGDDSKAELECAGCAHGFDIPSGEVFYYKWRVNVKQIIVEGVEINKNKNKEEVKYKFDGCYIAYSNRIFSNKKEAEKKATELMDEHNKEELKKLNSKEKSHKSWAWNVHYYRKCIKENEKQIIYYKKKLNFGESKIIKKEEK